MAQIVGAGLILAVLLVHLRGPYPAMAIGVAMLFVFGVLLFVMPELGRLMRLFGDLARRVDVEGLYLDIALRAIGIAYLSALGSQMSRDAGEQAIAAVIEFGGKILILVLALPIVAAIMQTLMRLLP